MSNVTTAPGASPPSALSSARTRRFAIGAIGVAALAFGVIAFGNIGKNLVYYWGPTELHAAGDKAVGATIRLGGLVAPGSLSRNSSGSGLEFDVIDRQGGRVHVHSTSVPPQMFREKIGVVVEGTMTTAGTFESNRLMVSHSNEYRIPSEDARVDVKKLMKSTNGLEPEKGKP